LSYVAADRDGLEGAMRRWWSADELVERWSLTPQDLSLLVGRIDAGKLGLAAQLAYWRRYGAFPNEETDPRRQ
jgi:hypothetical protein